MADTFDPNRIEFPLGSFKDSFSLEYELLEKKDITDIDAELLGASISGFSILSKTIARRILNTEIEIKVVANREGCFEVLFQAIGVIGSIFSIAQFFGYDYQKTKSTVTGLILKAASALSDMIKRTDGDVEKIIKEIKDDETLSSEEKWHLENLVRDRKLQAALDDFTKVLEHKEIKEITVKEDDKPVFNVPKASRTSFKLISPEEETVKRRLLSVKIVYLSPTETQWQFQSSNLTFWAEVEDREFLLQARSMGTKNLKGATFDADVTTISTRKRGMKRATVRHYITTIHFDQRNFIRQIQPS